jgi:hypothetical protein
MKADITNRARKLSIQLFLTLAASVKSKLVPAIKAAAN